MARLHDHRRGDADQRVDQQAEQARERELREVQRVLEGVEAFLHVGDAEEQEAHAGEDVTEPLEGFRVLEDQDHAEDQHRHRVGRDVDLESEACNQPGAGRGAEVGAEDDADARGQAEQPGAEKGNGNHRNQRAGLHDRGGDDAEQHAQDDDDRVGGTGGRGRPPPRS